MVHNLVHKVVRHSMRGLSVQGTSVQSSKLAEERKAAECLCLLNWHHHPLVTCLHSAKSAHVMHPWITGRLREWKWRFKRKKHTYKAICLNHKQWPLKRIPVISCAQKHTISQATSILRHEKNKQINCRAYILRKSAQPAYFSPTRDAMGACHC